MNAGPKTQALIRASVSHDRLREGLWPIVNTGFWHMTHPCRIDGILTTGKILAESPTPERARRPHTMPNKSYVRGLGGVSVFDFDNPLAKQTPEYAKKCSFTVPFPDAWGGAVWMKLDPDQLDIIRATDLFERYKTDYAGATCMTSPSVPVIDATVEAAAMGDIPWTAVSEVHLVTFLGPGYRQYSPGDPELRRRLAREITEWRRNYMAMLEENLDDATWRQCYSEFMAWW